MKTVTESIFSGETCIIPMAEVLFIERDKRESYKDGITVIFKGTTYSNEAGEYNNNAYLRKEEAKSFIQCWCAYRSELEADTLMDLNT